MRRAHTTHDCDTRHRIHGSIQPARGNEQARMGSAGQDFGGKFARRFRIRNVQVSNHLRKALPYPQRCDPILRARGRNVR